MDRDQQLPSDGQLAVAARDGVAEAWDELELRHGRIALAVARKLYGRHGKSRTRIGLDRLRAEVLHGAGPVVDDRNRALRAFRPRCVAAVTDGGFADPTTPAGDEHQALASSFASLPEPWQAALWHHYVDLEPTAGFTNVVGRTWANADLLVERAIDDLFTAFVDELRIAGVELTEAEQHDRRSGIGAMLADALVPRVAAMSVVDYRLAIGGESPVDATGPRPVVEAAVPPPVPPAVSPPVSPAVSPPVPPAPVIPVRFDDVVAEPPVDTTRELPVVERIVTAERPVLPPSQPPPTSVAAEQHTSALAASRQKRNLIIAILIGLVAVAALGAGIAVIDSLRDDDASTLDDAATADPEIGGRSDRVNLFGMQFTIGASGADLGVGVDVAIEIPGPIFQNSRGTLRASLVNNGVTDVAPRVAITPPDGITVDSVTGATCDDLSAAPSARCDLSIPPGDTVTVDVAFALTDPAIGRFVVDTNVVTDPIDVAIEPVRGLRHGAVDRGEIVMVGNTVLSCDDAAPSCAGARDGTDLADRRDLPTAFVGVVPEFGVINSSSATLDLGEAGVAAAYLFWSGDLGSGDSTIPADGAVRQVTVAPPDGRPSETVEAAELSGSPTDDTGYIAYADVTDLVAAAGSGPYRIGNVQSVEVAGSHAGWSLVVVTSDDRQPLRELVVVSPFDRIGAGSTAQITVPTDTAQAAPTVLQLLSFDADRGSIGDELVVNGERLGLGGDVFDGGIIGTRDPAHVENFGTGIAAYRFDLDAPDATVAVRAESTDDEFHIGVITLTIDLE